MARKNDKSRQRTAADEPALDRPPDAFEDMQGYQPQTGPTWTGANGTAGKSDVPLSGPAVHLVCPLCRQPVYPGYGMARDDAEFVHFDCLRHERTAHGGEHEAT